MNILLATLLILQNGTVTGQLRSLSGTPASGVRVAAMAMPEPNAAGGGALVSLAETDSSGHYRLENIPPGRYYIQAGLVDLPSYYPGVTSLEAAASISIAAGALVERMDFTMARPVAVRIRGRVPVNGKIKPVRIVLDSGTMDPFARNNTTVNADGSFEFARVMPGSYALSAVPSGVLPNFPIFVNDEDVDVGVPNGPGFKLTGTVGLGLHSPRPSTLRVVLTGSSAWTQLETAISAGGTFEFVNLPAGTYAIGTRPGGSTSASTIAVADRDISGIVVPAFLELKGRVTMEDGLPLPRFSSALMIEARHANGASLTTAVRPAGGFRIPLTEGEYRFSFRELPPDLVVKSMTYGATDLLTEPARFDGSLEVSEIRLILGKR